MEGPPTQLGAVCDMQGTSASCNDIDHSIPSDVFTRILLRCGVRTILNARTASSLLREPAAAAVEAPGARDGELEAEAWVAFSAASQLYVFCSTPEGPDHGTLYFTNTLQLLPTLPARCSALSIAPPSKGCSYQQWTSSDTVLLAQALLASAWSSTLQQVSLTAAISLTAADIILKGLLRLAHAELTVYDEGSYVPPPPPSPPSAALQEASGSSGEDTDSSEDNNPACHTIWAPPIGPAMKSIRLHCVARSGAKLHMYGPLGRNASVLLDVAAITPAAGQLNSLAFTGTYIQHWEALAQLHSLQRLQAQLPFGCGWCSRTADADAVSDARALTSLSQLQELLLPGMPCPPAAWQLLASLPALHLQSLQLQQDSPSCSNITQLRMCGSGSSLFSHPEPAGAAAGPGLLARAMPGLVQLSAPTYYPQRLARDLLGHPALQELQADCDNPVYRLLEGLDAGPWPGQLLSQLPELSRLALQEPAVQLQPLLAAVAGCSKLTQLQLQLSVRLPGADQVPAEGLVALAAGACRHSLQRVVLEATRAARSLPLPVLCELLRGSMTALREVRCTLALPADVGSGEVVQEVVRGLLAQHGASEAWGGVQRGVHLVDRH